MEIPEVTAAYQKMRGRKPPMAVSREPFPEARAGSSSIHLTAFVINSFCMSVSPVSYLPRSCFPKMCGISRRHTSCHPGFLDLPSMNSDQRVCDSNQGLSG